jgi:hypothetical protein
LFYQYGTYRFVLLSVIAPHSQVKTRFPVPVFQVDVGT